MLYTVERFTYSTLYERLRFAHCERSSRSASPSPLYPFEVDKSVPVPAGVNLILRIATACDLTVSWVWPKVWLISIMPMAQLGHVRHLKLCITWFYNNGSNLLFIHLIIMLLLFSFYFFSQTLFYYYCYHYSNINFSCSAIKFLIDIGLRIRLTSGPAMISADSHIHYDPDLQSFLQLLV